MLRATQNLYVDETGNVWTIEELEKLIAEWSDLFRISNLVEANIITITLTEYYNAPAKLMDLIQIHRAVLDEIREKEIKNRE